MTEDREQTSGADREQTSEQTSSDVEAHSTIGQTGSGQVISQTDDDESDVEAHTMIGQTSSQTSPQANP